ncbi:MAG: chemotaxis protein CheB [Panacagrimonas sp.]|nr:chemotaxis protein CheB [Panacagrimonas sp.]MCC2657366.1 chemotaxis protein CheB [Panacagrimonas sp.]
MRRRRYEAVVIAASTGGIEALRAVLRAVDPRIAAPVVIVQHTASENAQALCDVLAAGSAIPVVEAESRQPLVNGCAYLAPPGYHLLVEPGPRAALSMDEKVCHVRPSADVLFTSAADVWRGGLIGIVLTGANEDGAAGMAAIRSRRGLAVVQKPEEAEMREMPEATLRRAGADHVLSLQEIGPLLNRLLCR